MHQVTALLVEHGKPALVALAVRCARIGPSQLFPSVKQSQRQDREPVCNHTGSLRVLLAALPLVLVCGPECREQQGVDMLGQVIAALIHAIDLSLDCRNVVIARPRATRLILDMPQQVIGRVLRLEQCGKLLQRRRGEAGVAGLVPPSGACVLQMSKGDGIDQSVGGKGHAKESGEDRW